MWEMVYKSSCVELGAVRRAWRSRREVRELVICRRRERYHEVFVQTWHTSSFTPCRSRILLLQATSHAASQRAAKERSVSLRPVSRSTSGRQFKALEA